MREPWDHSQKTILSPGRDDRSVRAREVLSPLPGLGSFACSSTHGSRRGLLAPAPAGTEGRATDCFSSHACAAEGRPATRDDNLLPADRKSRMKTPYADIIQLLLEKAPSSSTI